MPQPTVIGRLAEQQSPAIAAACGLPLVPAV